MDNSINVSHIPKAELLIELYNNARVQGMGAFHARNEPMNMEEAEELTQNDTQYFDYLHGRVMKTEIDGKILHPGLYDRDNGLGAAQRCVDAIYLRKG